MPSSKQGVPAETEIVFEVGISRYPRRGQRLAPETLRPLLAVPIPDGRIGSGDLLCDLDESAWERFGEKTCRKLADAVLKHLVSQQNALRARFAKIRLPQIQGQPGPLILQLEPRTFNCLKSADCAKTAEQLATLSILDVLNFPSFGVKCLVDLLTTLEAHLPCLHKPTPEVTTASHRLLRLKHAGEIQATDPRLGSSLQLLGVPGENLKEIVERLSSSSHCPISPVLLARRLEELHDQLRQISRVTLEEELAGLLAHERNPRNRELVLKYLGWDGRGTRTLEAVGSEYRLTRERVRQICDRHLEYLKARKAFLPVLDRTLKFIGESLPASVVELEAKLATAGLTEAPFQLESIQRAAEVLGRTCPFVLETGYQKTYALAPGSAGLATDILQAARKSISHWGVTTIEDVTAQVRQSKGTSFDVGFAGKVLMTQDDFEWLDEASGWFWLTSVGRNSLLTQIDKVLSVAARIPVSELRVGVSRNHRREGFAPPQRVLLALCRRLPGCRVEENIVVADPPRDWEKTLADTERTLAGVLKEHGPVLERQRLEDLCTARGLKRDTFYIHLTYSPVIERFAQGVYGLRGSAVPPGLAESLATRRSKSKLVLDYGWKNDGGIEVSYRLSKSVLSNGIVSVPAGIRQYVQGRFTLKTADAVEVGNLVAKDTSAWGLGPFFRRRGGEPGDILTIRFDLKQRVAVVELGDEPADESAPLVGAPHPDAIVGD
ncbi:MAG: hypothetical protein HY735_02165 [Verrucomicrobia bacterium]|nr:hypothetical protein [Verrucomicrobiota bacterium]